MSNIAPENTKGTSTPRPPIVAVLGHINHGKSTLLDYIRKTNVAQAEAGGITQHLGAYEVVHKTKEGKESKITFLDTPGHEAFKSIRSRGATVADIAVLVISGEEGVKPQTREALEFIKKKKIPYLVAITKIDKPTADVERTKQSLAEHEIYVEGYGGDIPCLPLSSKTGQGVNDLLDMILLLTELHALRGDTNVPAQGFVIEAQVDKTKGIAATLIIRNGNLKKGAFIVAEDAYAPTRCFENVFGKPITEAGAGESARSIGWSTLPRVGAAFQTMASKREAETFVRASGKRARVQKRETPVPVPGEAEKIVLPIVLKADTSGSLEALEGEVLKRATERVDLAIIHKGVGHINETDLKSASGTREPLIAGFNVGVDLPAKGIIERGGFEVGIFEVIYKLTEWLDGIVKSRTPKEKVEEIRGNARILKIFSGEKDKQIVGGKVLDGELSVGNEFKVLRRDVEIGKGKIRELQHQKTKIASAPKDSEFGALVGSSIEVMPGDRIEAFTIVER